MAINSIGYAGTVTDAEWARLIPYAGGAMYTVAGPFDFMATPAAGDRNVSISTGAAAGAGIFDESDSAVVINLPSVGSGSRWDLIGLKRDWNTSTSTLVRVAGSATKEIPDRDDTPGVLDVQPLWLLRVAAGQTSIQEFVDLRVFVSEGGAWAKDDLVKSYMQRVGSVLTIGSVPWLRRLDATGSPQWGLLSPGNRGSTALRDATYGTPGSLSAGQKVALANSAVQWFNTEKNWLEQYFARTADGGITLTPLATEFPSGWYPIDGVLPKFLMHCQTTQAPLAADTAYRMTSGHAVKYEIGLDHSSSTGNITIQQAGRYRVWGRLPMNPTANPSQAYIFVTKNDGISAQAVPTSSVIGAASIVAEEEKQADIVGFRMWFEWDSVVDLNVGDYIRVYTAAGSSSWNAFVYNRQKAMPVAVEYVGPPLGGSVL